MNDYFDKASYAAQTAPGRFGRVLNKGVGFFTGNTVTERQYNEFNNLTHALIDNYNVEAFLIQDRNESVDILLKQLKLFYTAINSIYKIRLNYLDKKIISDPRNTDTLRKIGEVKQEIENIESIIIIIKNALIEKLGATNELDNFLENRELKTYSPGIGSYNMTVIDYIVLQDVVRGFILVLEGLANVAGEILTTMGGKIKNKKIKSKITKSKTTKSKSNKRSKKTKSVKSVKSVKSKKMRSKKYL